MAQKYHEYTKIYPIKYISCYHDIIYIALSLFIALCLYNLVQLTNGMSQGYGDNYYIR